MPANLVTTWPLSVVAKQSWLIEIDAELSTAAPAATSERVQALAALLACLPGVSRVAAEAHCDGRYVRATLAVEAYDLSDAVERAGAYLRSCAVDAGLGPLILVAARCAR